MDADLALRLYHRMQRIRLVEEAIAERYPEGRMRCPTHLSIGQEAVPAAIGEILTERDPAVSTHRGHAHYLGKGGSLPAMIAELHGKATGCAGGKGGSMHLIDRAAGFMGTSAIVGNSIPIGVGLALALQTKGEAGLACVFLGDGAIEEGAFYESVNFAAVRKLPVLFLCENNLYSVYTPLATRQPAGRRIADMVAALGITATHGDGNDALACHRQIAEAAAGIRAGSGPRFLEFLTYRWREHCGHAYDNDLGYRSVAEFETWRARDPIARLRREALAADPALADHLSNRLADADAAIRAEIDAAFRFAEESPFPDPAEAHTGVYA